MPLGERVDYGDAKYVGIAVNGFGGLDIAQGLQIHGLADFDFLVLPLAGSRESRPADLPHGVPHLPSFCSSDLSLRSSGWSTHVVGSMSNWIDVDSEDPNTRKDSLEAFATELGWARHLSINAVVLPPPKNPKQVARYAATVARAVHQPHSTMLWFRVPLAGSTESDDSSGDPMEWWAEIKAACRNDRQLAVLLELSADLPSPELISRWEGEPVKAVLLPQSLFLTNRSGYPVLPKSHQRVVSRFFEHGVQVVLGMEGEWGGEGMHPLEGHLQYMCHLFRQLRPLDELELASVPYRDFIQVPLQPLQDNLEACTYETFEKDTIKYTTYQEAITQALRDLSALRKAGLTQQEGKPLNVMVVGAGRGPLVRCSLEASKETGIPIHVWAVEKNRNALVTLRDIIASEALGSQVTLVHQDMRHWDAPVKADVMVSELLGSFGCNELSPECLDGAQRFLAEDGICIPQKYTNYLQPISTVKDLCTGHDSKLSETPSVVKLHRFYPIAPTQEGMTFSHPSFDTESDKNEREIHLEWERDPEEGMATIHALAGYFKTWLYKDVVLSTHPADHTPGMYSWFPIVFPVRSPIHVAPGDTIRAHMWRRTDGHRVWYEWTLSKPLATPVHNLMGRSCYVGL